MMIRLLLDFGLVVLIWMTQLIVYPSFTRYTEDDLYQWHLVYTKRISVIVMPLMIGQLATHLYLIIQQVNILSVTAFVFVLLAWVNTFLFAVPLHNKIANGNDISESAAKLVTVNAWRTGFWTIVLLIGLVEYFGPY